MLGLGLSLGLAPIQGVPLRITINGVVYERLIGADGAWLTGADGLPLYGRI